MAFSCSFSWEEEIHSWEGAVDQIIPFGSHYEVRLSGPSGIRLLLGKSTTGLFACIPDFQAGCHLSTLQDEFYNRERLTRALGNPIGGTTIAAALKVLSGTIDLS